MRLKRDIYSGITATRDMADDLRQVGRHHAGGAGRRDRLAGYQLCRADGRARASSTTRARRLRRKGAVAGQGAVDAGDRRQHRYAARDRNGERNLRDGGENLRQPSRRTGRRRSRERRIGRACACGRTGWCFPATPVEVVDAGVDTVSHTCYLAYQAMAQRPDSYQHRFPIDASLFEHDNPVMAQHCSPTWRRRGTILDATLHVYRAVEDAAAKEQASRRYARLRLLAS